VELHGNDCILPNPRKSGGTRHDRRERRGKVKTYGESLIDATNYQNKTPAQV
jgi:hypothetical protein